MFHPFLHAEQPQAFLFLAIEAPAIVSDNKHQAITALSEPDRNRRGVGVANCVTQSLLDYPVDAGLLFFPQVIGHGHRGSVDGNLKTGLAAHFTRLPLERG